MFDAEQHRSLIRQALDLAEAQFGLPIYGARFTAFLKAANTAFDLRTSGFGNLRSFLERYPEVVHVGHDGRDLTISKPANDITNPPASQPRPPSVGSRTSTAAPIGSAIVVRHDVWQAFSHIDPAVDRFYDRTTDEAILLPRERSETEPEAIAQRREFLQQFPDRFVSIHPIKSEEKLRVMRAFAAALPPGKAKQDLEEALAQAVWFRAALIALRTHELEQNWKNHWTDVVVARLREWGAAHQLQIQGFLRTVTAHKTTTTAPLVPHADRRTEDSPRNVHARSEVAMHSKEVRRRILDALSRMPTSALLALPIPAEYLLD